MNMVADKNPKNNDQRFEFPGEYLLDFSPLAV